MDDDASRDEIARLEEEMETLAERIARCRKLSLAAKLAIVAGLSWVALTLLSAVPFASYALVGALALGIGGIVLLGSNATTWKQNEKTLHAVEKLRADLIEGMDLPTVGADRRQLH